MKVSAVNPPFLRRFSRGQRSPAVTRSGTLYYPIWLSYAAGALEADGYLVDLVDAPAAGLDAGETVRRVDSFGPGLVIVESSTPSIESDARFADRLAEADGRFVLLVGTHPSALPAPAGRSVLEKEAAGDPEQVEASKRPCAVDPGATTVTGMESFRICRPSCSSTTPSESAPENPLPPR